MFPPRFIEQRTRNTTPPWARRFVLRIVLFAASACFYSANAQVFQVQGGSSSLFQASGGSVELHAPGYEGWLGAGLLAGEPRAGAFLQTRWRGSIMSLGDEMIPFPLATDVFDGSHYFFGRGAGIAKDLENVRVFGFAGASSEGFGAPFFRGAHAERGSGLLFLDGNLSAKLSWFSRNIVSSRKTSIHGFEWRPGKSVHGALAGGVGSSQGYLASSLTAEQEWVSLRAAYILADSEFRRVAVKAPVTAESDRGNVLLSVHPKSYFNFSAGRRNLLEPATADGPGLRAAVNQYSANATVARVAFSASLFDSRVRGVRTIGESFSVGRALSGRLQGAAYYFRSRSGDGRRSSSLLGIFREVLSPRLGLQQLVNHSRGQTSLSFGGDFTSNRISVGAEYQTVYVPFRPASPFVQVLMFNLRLQPLGNLQANVGTYVAPDGSVKYTAYGGTLLYRNGANPANPPLSFKFSKYVLRGRVVDEERNPVAGAALRVDGETLFSDSQGEFFGRMARSRAYPLQVKLDEFLIPGSFEVVAAPSTVTAQPEQRVIPIVIILRRVPRS